MRRIHKRVKVTNFRYQLNPGLLWFLADKLAPLIYKMVRDIHLESKKLNSRPLPSYSALYIEAKAHMLGVPEYEIYPNLELGGEFHKGAKGESEHNKTSAKVKYSLSSQGEANLLAARAGSGKVWEAFDRIGKIYWKEVIMPSIEDGMEDYRMHMVFLESVPPNN